MIKHIAVIALLCLSSSSTFASYIYADDFSVGSDTTQLADNATLSWLNGEEGLSGSSVSSPLYLPHQHFGGSSESATWELRTGLYPEILGSTQPHTYQALQIDFNAPARSFGMKTESLNGDGFGVYVFDTAGNFVEELRANLSRTYMYPATQEGSFFDGSFHWDFAYDVGQIKLGSNSAAGYVYALDVAQLPEPSSIILLGLGLVCILISRRSFNPSFLQQKAV